MATKNKTEQEILEDLSSKYVIPRERAAAHRNATPEILLIAIKHKCEYVRCNAARQRYGMGLLQGEHR